NLRYDGIAIASRIPMMMITTSSSISVNPSFALSLSLMSFTPSCLRSGRRLPSAPLPLGSSPPRVIAAPQAERGARSPAPLAASGVSLAYGQEPETMSADGPAFLNVAWPTVDWMQYVVADADCT